MTSRGRANSFPVEVVTRPKWAWRGSGRLPTAGRLIASGARRGPQRACRLAGCPGRGHSEGQPTPRPARRLVRRARRLCRFASFGSARSRWSLLQRVVRSKRPPIRRLPFSSSATWVTSEVLPARIGDAARAVLVGRPGGRPDGRCPPGPSFLERIIDTLLLALLVFPAAIVARAPERARRGGGVAAVLAAAVLLLAQTRIPVSMVGIAHRRARWSPATALLNHAARFLEAMKAKGRVLTIASAMGLTLGIWALEATVYWLTGRSLDIGLSPAGALLVAAVAVLGTAVPSVPGYIGTFELAATSLARALGVEPSAALAFAILVTPSRLYRSPSGRRVLLGSRHRPKVARQRADGPRNRLKPRHFDDAGSATRGLRCRPRSGRVGLDRRPAFGPTGPPRRRLRAGATPGRACGWVRDRAGHLAREVLSPPVSDRPRRQGPDCGAWVGPGSGLASPDHRDPAGQSALAA